MLPAVRLRLSLSPERPMLSKFVRRRLHDNSLRQQSSQFPSEDDVLELILQQTLDQLFKEARESGQLVLARLSQSRPGTFSPLSVVGDGPAEQWAKD